MDRLRFVVIGLGGYAQAHLNAVRWLETQGLCTLAGVVALQFDREANSKLYRKLQRKKIAFYDSIDHFLNEGTATADVLTVPIGIHQHVPVSSAAMRAGLHVYCEKPVAATVQEVDELIACVQETKQKIAIGFQHIYSHSIQALKARICDGRLGRIKSISLMCGWPRSISYYTRNDWAGKLQKDGHWILDSPANNANSHYLFNMLYLCSTDTQAAASPAELRAELYRAYEIESADTTQIQFTTGEGSRGHIILSHAGEKEVGPVMQFECEHGRGTWLTDLGKTTIEYESGESERFDNETHAEWRYEGFKDLIDAIQSSRPPLCTPALARAQTLAVNLMHESCPDIRAIPEEYLVEGDAEEMWPPGAIGRFRKIRGMDEIMARAFREGRFISELGVPWAGETGSTVKSEGYTSFPRSRRIA